MTTTYESCINCGLEVTDPTNPSEETKYVHLVNLESACDPEDLDGAMADEQRAGIGYVACPLPPTEELETA